MSPGNKTGKRASTVSRQLDVTTSLLSIWNLSVERLRVASASTMRLTIRHGHDFHPSQANDDRHHLFFPNFILICINSIPECILQMKFVVVAATSRRALVYRMRALFNCLFSKAKYSFHHGFLLPDLCVLIMRIEH